MTYAIIIPWLAMHLWCVVALFHIAPKHNPVQLPVLWKQSFWPLFLLPSMPSIYMWSWRNLDSLNMNQLLSTRTTCLLSRWLMLEFPLSIPVILMFNILPFKTGRMTMSLFCTSFWESSIPQMISPSLLVGSFIHTMHIILWVTIDAVLLAFCSMHFFLSFHTIILWYHLMWSYSFTSGEGVRQLMDYGQTFIALALWSPSGALTLFSY